MAWQTAKIASITKPEGRVIYTVTFTDDSTPQNTFTRQMEASSAEQLKIRCKAEIDQANLVLAAATGVVVDQTVTAPATPVLTAEQKFQVNFLKLQRMLQLVSAGVLAADDARIVTLRNKLIGDYQDGF